MLVLCRDVASCEGEERLGAASWLNKTLGGGQQAVFLCDPGFEAYPSHDVDEDFRCVPISESC